MTIQALAPRGRVGHPQPPAPGGVASDDGVVAADQTIANLIAAIQAAGGPTYDYREIDPVNDQDGGEPGGNIRVVFLFKVEPGLTFVSVPAGAGSPTTAESYDSASGSLVYNPGPSIRRALPGPQAASRSSASFCTTARSCS